MNAALVFALAWATVAVLFSAVTLARLLPRRRPAPAAPGALPAVLLLRPLDEPTERELQILRGMSEGHSNGEIGRELFLSEDTVKTHARRLFQKLGARDRAHAVALGLRNGLFG